ncbi:Bromodomain-containing protein [Myxozyma melibiosi]|uniref:Bromodomain-containing protein n=1 Tax=Myxozyma melibiosi TaxID=54550 RepID=A0ABR1FEY2_9ASCO
MAIMDPAADLAKELIPPLSPIPSPPLHHTDSADPSDRPVHAAPDSDSEPPAKRIKSDADETATTDNTQTTQPEPATAPIATPSAITTTENEVAAPEPAPAPASAAPEPALASTPAPAPSDATPASVNPISSPAPTPVPPGTTLPKHQTKYAHSMLRSLKRLKDAYPFLVPVDPIKLNIPDYLNVITTPMDLSTMEKKLTSSQYATIDQFVTDFELIVSNCIRYNGPESKIAEMGRSLKTSFERQLKQMPPAEVKPDASGSGKRKKSLPKDGTTEQAFALTPSGIPIIRRDSTSAESGRPKREIHPPKPKDLPYSESKPRRKKYAAELKFCSQVLKELQSKKYEAFSYPFLLPVDPVALNCPSYFKVIKKPMDLSTIQAKLNNNEYETGDEFEEDVRLMFRNCYKFNPESSPVNAMGHRLEMIFDKKWAEKPAPPPARVTESPIEESSEEESEEEEDNSDQINLLEQQLMAMQSQLLMMKKAKKEASKKKKKESSKKKTSTKRKGSKGAAGSTVPVPHVSYDMKKELSEKIMELSAPKLQHVVKMIQESMPHLKNAEQEEIELDVDQLDPFTLVKLYNYVTKNTPGATVKPSASVPGSSGTAGAAGKSKKKDQKKKLASLEKQIKTMQNSDSDDSSSSSEEDSDESSSEEE